MQKVIRYTVLTAFFGLFLSVVAVSSANAQLKEILDRMDTYNRALQSLKADVTMVKTNSQLQVSDTTIGSTTYLAKTPKHAMAVRIDWTKPLEEHLSVIGDSYELWRPRLNQVIAGKTQGAKNSASVGNALAFMTMSRDQLKTNYKVDYLGEEQISGGVQTWHLQLTPKTATSYKVSELWVDGDGMPRQAKVTEQNNDSTTVLLTSIVTQVKIDSAIFKLPYPSTVKRIKA